MIDLTSRLPARLAALPLEPETLARLEEAARRMSPEERAAWVEALDAAAGGPRTTSRLLDLLTDEGAESRQRGLELLRGSGDPRLWDEVLAGCALDVRGRSGLTGELPPTQELFEAVLSDPRADLQEVRALRLEYCRWLRALPFARLSGLETLEIVGAPGLKSLEGLRGLPSLKQLRIAVCEDLTDISALSSLPALETLELDVHSLKQAPFAGLWPLTALRTLGLRGSTSYGSRDALSLKGLRAPRLERLHLRGIDQLESLEALTSAPLRELSLGRSSRHSIQDPGPLLAMDQLQVFSDRSGVHTGEELEAIRLWAALETSDPIYGRLINRWVEDGGLTVPPAASPRRLSGLAHLAHLERLTIYGGGRGDQLLMESLAPLERCESLRELALIFEGPPSAGARNALKRAEPLAALANLEVARIDFATSLETLPVDVHHPHRKGRHREIPWVYLEGAEAVRAWQLRLLAASPEGGTREALAARVASLAALGPVQLDLSGLGGLVDLETLRGISGIAGLKLSGCPALQDLSALAEVEGLESLEIGGCPSLDLATLPALPGLKRLSLARSEALEDLSALAPIAPALVALEEVDLHRCGALKDASALAGCPALRKLNLGHCEALGAKSLSSRRSVEVWFGLTEG